MASAAQKRIKSISYAKYGYIFILPFFLIYLFFQFWPLVNTFIISFKGNESTVDDFVGFDNYKTILFSTDYDEDVSLGISPKLAGMEASEKAAAMKAEQAKQALGERHNSFVKSFGNTIILWLGNFIPQIILSLSLAVWFTDAKLKIPGKGFFKVIMYMPNIITAASVGVLFLSLCSEAKYGALNQIMYALHMSDDPVSGVQFVTGIWPPRIIIMFIQTWMWFGNTMIMLMSGIMGINPSLFEAASIDGASSGQVFRKITLPLLSPIMVYTLVTSMIGGLQMFDIPYLYHQGTEVNKNVQTVAIFIYNAFHKDVGSGYNFGYSGAASVILFLVTLALGCITFYMNRDLDAIAKKKQRKKLAKQAKLQNKQFGGLSI
jgi:ABC transporter, permease protein